MRQSVSRLNNLYSPLGFLCRPARIHGWQCRFWQGSHDHRGTPEHPGRVATLVEDEKHSCAGMAYEVTPDVFAHLDHREKNGYLRIFTEFEWLDGSGAVTGLVYIAGPDNDAFLGAASEAEIAAHIARLIGAPEYLRGHISPLQITTFSGTIQVFPVASRHRLRKTQIRNLTT